MVESCCEAVEVTKVEPPWGAQRANQDRHALRPGFAVHSALFGAPLSCFEAVSVDSRPAFAPTLASKATKLGASRLLKTTSAYLLSRFRLGGAAAEAAGVSLAAGLAALRHRLGAAEEARKAAGAGEELDPIAGHEDPRATGRRGRGARWA